MFFLPITAPFSLLGRVMRGLYFTVVSAPYKLISGIFNKKKKAPPRAVVVNRGQSLSRDKKLQQQHVEVKEVEKKDAAKLGLPSPRREVSSHVEIIDLVLPPGPMGADVQAGTYGPVVRYVEEDSPLLPSVHVGDVMVEIDGMPTNNMTFEACTEHVRNRKDSSRAFKFARMVIELVAPPGPLGFEIDEGPHGPVVHVVDKESPLFSVVRAGDVLVELDGMLTSKMTLDSFVTHLQRRKSSPRAFKVTRAFEGRDAK